MLLHRRLTARESGWSLAFGTLATLGQLAALFLLLGPMRVPHAAIRPETTRVAESVSFVMPNLSPRSAPAPDSRVGRARDPILRIPVAPLTWEIRPSVAPVDTASAIIDRSPATRVGASPDPRLSPARLPGAAPVGPIYGRNPFVTAVPLSRVVFDSSLAALNDAMPALIRAYVMTQADRDSVTKVANLAMRLAGRPLLVPPDPHLVTDFSIDAPVLSRGPSRAERRRDSVSFAENRRRLERLHARAKARIEAARVADSIARQVAPR